MISAEGIADTAGFDLLGDRHLAHDVEVSVREAHDAGAVFAGASDPLAIFRESVRASIRNIESERGLLLQDFLRRGPYEGGGEVPPEMASQRLTDDQTAAGVAFIHSFMVNTFKGCLAELLALSPCLTILGREHELRRLPAKARLYVGDSVEAMTRTGSAFAKGADLNILSAGPHGAVTLLGVAEIKSYRASRKKVMTQVERHLTRAALGLRIQNKEYRSPKVRIGEGNGLPLRIVVVPSGWKLPRTFRFEPTDHGDVLQPDPPEPPNPRDSLRFTGPGQWWVTLRWSREALESAAHGMTFWYMEKLGETVYSEGVPGDWAEMSPAAAGQNAAKMMLYYAILRARSPEEEQKAIALYSSYGFGYSLGMNFRNKSGAREMLWPEDLREILETGRTAAGCRITNSRR